MLSIHDAVVAAVLRDLDAVRDVQGEPCAIATGVCGAGDAEFRVFLPVVVQVIAAARRPPDGLFVLTRALSPERLSFGAWCAEELIQSLARRGRRRCDLSVENLHGVLDCDRE